MPYVDPHTVQSPKGRVSDVEILYDKGPINDSWSIAAMKWDGKKVYGIRWNGEVSQPGSGTPQSRGNATWFILPKEIVDAVVGATANLERDKNSELLHGYRQMAADVERESEAQDWSEALIRDGFDAR